MPFRLIEIPTLGRALTNIMAAPSSAEPETHAAGLDRYRALGGNCLHLHGEGGETHTRRATGEWLRGHGLRNKFFVCTQICHEGWDVAAGRPVDRFTAEAVAEDIAEDLELLGTDCVDIVYLDDRPSRSFAPLLDALCRELEAGRIRAIGVRNFRAERLRAAHSYLADKGGLNIAAVVTTELALPVATAPLWPEYVPFDTALREAVSDLGLEVFAHAGDINIGQCLFGDADSPANWRPEWVRRWDAPANSHIVECVRTIAADRTVSEREMSLAWLLHQEFPVIVMSGLPELAGAKGIEYERASELALDESDLKALRQARATVRSPRR